MNGVHPDPTFQQDFGALSAPQIEHENSGVRDSINPYDQKTPAHVTLVMHSNGEVGGVRNVSHRAHEYRHDKELGCDFTSRAAYTRHRFNDETLPSSSSNAAPGVQQMQLAPNPHARAFRPHSLNARLFCCLDSKEGGSLLHSLYGLFLFPCMLFNNLEILDTNNNGEHSSFFWGGCFCCGVLMPPCYFICGT
jgi:hypothetical protein